MSDFHCSRGNWGYAGTYSNMQGDNATARRGVWVNTQQVYSFGVTALPGVAATTLGNQLARLSWGPRWAPYRRCSPPSSRAAPPTGRAASSSTGRRVGLEAITYETEPHPAFNLQIEKIYTANVSPSGTVGLFLQKRDSATMTLSDATAFWDGESVSWFSKVGDQIQVGGQSATITRVPGPGP